MIVKPADADRMASNPPKDLVAVLVFGPDEGLVRERASRLARSVVADLSDPFRVADIDEAALDADPARLMDEAQALSMVGGRRVVRVRGASNALAKAVTAVLASRIGDSLIVVEAGDLPKSAALRRVFEEADKAAAIACYPDKARDLEELIRAELKRHGLTIDPEALDDAVSRLGSDRGITRSELEKLSLFAMDDGTVTEGHVLAVMGDESELRMEEAFDAAGLGDFTKLDTLLARLWLGGTSPVAVLRQALSHFQRLLLVRAEVDDGKDLSAAIEALRPKVHFPRAQAFRAQAQRFTIASLNEALDLLYEAEALAKTTAVPAEAATGRALLSVAALAHSARG